ncbi:hypothetical protein ACFC63_21020 [Streptomyces albidoflavus]
MNKVVAGFDQPELDTIARWLTGTVSVMRDATLALAAENRDRQVLFGGADVGVICRTRLISCGPLGRCV